MTPMRIDAQGFPELPPLLVTTGRLLFEPIMGTGELITLLVLAYDNEKIVIQNAFWWPPRKGIALTNLADMMRNDLSLSFLHSKSLEKWTSCLQGFELKLSKMNVDTHEDACEFMKKHYTIMNHPALKREKP